MVNSPIAWFQMRRAIPSNLEQAFHKPIALLLPDTTQTLTDRFGHGGSHTLSGQFRQFLRQFLSLSILNVQSHCESTILPVGCTILPTKLNFSNSPKPIAVFYL
jgi:hypothetical protein